MARQNINITVNGIREEYPVTYKSKTLKSNLSFASQVTDEGTLYVIKWDFNLGGATVNIPQNCILQFDGGVLRNGTLNLNGTRIWPCYDALTEGSVTVTGSPARGTIGIIENKPKWWSGNKWSEIGGELYYKEYGTQHFGGEVEGLEDFDYYAVPVRDLQNALEAYGHLAVKYGFTACVLLQGSDDDISMADLVDSADISNPDNFKLPYTFTSYEETSIDNMESTDYIFFCEKPNSKHISTDLRITY